MAKKATFNNDGFYALMVENGPVNNLIESVPSQFQNPYDGNARVVLLDSYCMLFPNGNVSNKPYVYFRHTDVAKNAYRFGNIVELGDGPFDVQKGVLHEDEAADHTTAIDHPYGKWDNNADMLGFASNGKVEQCYYSDRTTIREGSYLELTAYPWEGFTVYDHQSTYENCSCVFQPSTYFGVLDGKPVLGLGSFDRLCMKETSKDGFGGVPLAYIAFSAMGIRKDGRKEMVFASIGLSEGARTMAVYQIDGQPSIFCDEVEVEADWYRLPYVEDGTCVFKEATIRFGNKEFHFQGKWGTKGFLKQPRMEKHGQSQIFGTWYEGSKPYQHRLYYTFVENMEAYDENLKQYGFHVIDETEEKHIMK